MLQAEPSLYGVPLKYLSLVTLTLQNSLLGILMHYSRTHAAPYSAAAAVLLNEILKGSISFGVALYNTYTPTERGQTPPSERSSFEKSGPSNSDPFLSDLLSRASNIRKEIASPDCWKLSIPAILYVIQNNLQFVAASNLDPATFQVAYQLKIMSTALFSVILLKRRLTISKWVALFCLAMGVGIVQLQSQTAPSSTHVMDRSKGFAAVAAACMTSGLAGVYFEMVLKTSQADLWIRNIQLSAFSILPALVPAFFPNVSLFSSSPKIDVGPSTPLFEGFGFWAWSVVLCQVFGGLVTALVIKFSDNIMKSFATSLSIVLSFLAGVFLFNFRITPAFLVGCSIVLGATYSYNTSGVKSNTPRSHSPVPMQPASRPLTGVSLRGKTSAEANSTILHRRHSDVGTPGLITPDVNVSSRPQSPQLLDSSEQPYFSNTLHPQKAEHFSGQGSV